MYTFFGVDRTFFSVLSNVPPANMQLIKTIKHKTQQAGSSDVIEMHGSLWRVKLESFDGTTPWPGKCWENRDVPIVPSLTSEICSPGPHTHSESHLSKAELPSFKTSPSIFLFF